MSPAYDGPEDPHWYKDAIIYEVHVRAFHDSSADGVGDFRGLASRLDYLKDLGANALWLLPFYPSPLKDDGYDIADYTGVHPMYGTIDDVRALLKEAHARGIRVITELVLNHTSDQHPWFQRARRASVGSSERDFYVWSDSPERYRQARVIFKDFESSNWTWDPVAKLYYWHRFYSHQPDLNYDNPDVHRAMFDAVDFWFGLGVDGLRLDAVPYLYEREGTSCENLTETHAFLKRLRTHVDSKFRHRMLLAEANQWPEDAASYLGVGDECHMAFHFPVMPRMFMAVHMEDRHPIVDILAQTPPIPDACQWALFLRNHDELTLEMVTDEERDYMYRVYAHDHQARINLGIRRRLSPLLRNNRRKIELLNGLLFSLPGTPVIYYGDEIAMGDNFYLGDRNGVRTPMQWSSDRNAGFSRANPQKLYLPIIIDPEYHYEAVNVEAQQDNPHSLLWWMKRLIALSRKFKAFGRGALEMLSPANRKILAYLRRTSDETILVVANLSRFTQYGELDLAAFKGRVPTELFGRTEFPPIRETPYLLTLGPHSFYWFSLEPARSLVETRSGVFAGRSTLETKAPWTTLFEGKSRVRLEEALVSYLADRRWFAAKARRIKSVNLLEAIPLGFEGSESVFAPVQVEYTEGEAQTYALYLAFASGDRAATLRSEQPHALIADVRFTGEAGGSEAVLFDGLFDDTFRSHLLEAVAKRRTFTGPTGRLSGLPTPAGSSSPGGIESAPPSHLVKGEQSNSSVVYGDRHIFKFIRRYEPGPHPDVEVVRFLTEKARFDRVPAVLGTLEYARPDAEPSVVGIVNAFIPNQGDAWTYTLDTLKRYFEEVRSLSRPFDPGDDSGEAPLTLLDRAPSAPFQELVGSYFETARALGRRTADLHGALASAPEDPHFAPEPFTPFHQRSIYQSMRSQAGQVLSQLRHRQGDLDPSLREPAAEVLRREAEILQRFRALMDRSIGSMRIRCHGDYHLGQILNTGKDFVILDFEGPPARPLSERRHKRSAMRDVAGMIRSFHYAAYAALAEQTASGEVGPDRLPLLASAARAWYAWASSAFLRAYLDRAGSSTFVPGSRAELTDLLDAFLLDKAVYEVGYELNHRPGWVGIPILGVLQTLPRKPAG